MIVNMAHSLRCLAYRLIKDKEHRRQQCENNDHTDNSTSCQNCPKEQMNSDSEDSWDNEDEFDGTIDFEGGDSTDNVKIRINGKGINIIKTVPIKYGSIKTG